MLLTPSQTQIAKDTHRFRVLNCGRRAGKTSLAVEEIKGKAISKSCRIAYIAPTHQQARDIAWEALKGELKPVITKINESRLELNVKTQQGDTTLIVLRGWEAIETLRGQKYDFIVIDEVASMRNFWSMWQEVVRPTLTDTKGEALFASTPKGFNHFYELYSLDPDKPKAYDKQIQDEDFKSFQFTTYDNPFIPKEEVDKARDELTEDRFAQEYLADFRKTEGLVYKDFDRQKHIYTEDIPFVEKIAGLDHGFTNPTALLTILIDKDNNYFVDDEWYETKKTDDEIAEYVSAHNYSRVYPDPEAPSIIEVLRRKGVNVRKVIKNNDSVQNGISVVADLFRQGRLKINARCTNLIWELETYSYPEKKDGHNENENPIKENDHAVDALRYPLMMMAKNNKVTQFIPNLSKPVQYKPRTFIPKL